MLEEQVNELSFGVVLVNYNGWGDTKECLDSLIACCSRNVSIVVVDNASTENLIDEFRNRYPHVAWLRSELNTGWSGGNNIGIRYFLDLENRPDAILLLNNDTVVSEDIFSLLSKGLQQGFSIVGPVINEYSDREVVQTQGTSFNKVEYPNEFFSVVPIPAVLDRVMVTPVDIVNGCAVAIRQEIFEKIGLIDERFFLICEESDFCLRARNAGFRCGVLHRSLVFHKHSVSFARAGKPIQRYYAWRNLWLLLKNHSKGKGQKTILKSKILYFRQAYHIYSHECELGNRTGADAICDGIADAMLGRFGKWSEVSSWLGWVVKRTYSFVWWARGGGHRRQAV